MPRCSPKNQPLQTFNRWASDRSRDASLACSVSEARRLISSQPLVAVLVLYQHPVTAPICAACIGAYATIGGASIMVLSLVSR